MKESDERYSEKELLELEKLRHEVRHLKRWLIFNPQYMAPIIAICLTCLTVFYTFYSGLWDQKKLNLENANQLLRIEGEKLAMRKDSLSLQIALLTKERDIEISQNHKIREEFDSLQKQMAAVRKKYQDERIKVTRLLTEARELLDHNGSQEDIATKLRVASDILKGLAQRQFSEAFSDDFK